MNINMEKRFLEAPTVEMPRSDVDLSYEHQTTFNVGELIPIGCQQVYPGDTHKITTSKVIRLQTLLNPIYGTLYADIRHFFVPNRLIDEHFEELMGANKTSAWYPKVEYTTPMLGMNEPDAKADPADVPLGSLPDYFGVPVGYTGEFNAQPIRAYHKIWDDWYRDENLQDPLNIYTGQATHYMSDSDADYLTEYYMWPRSAARMHDMFSSCLPGPQKSSDPVTIPIASGTNYLPVFPRTETIPGAPEYSGVAPLMWYDSENYIQGKATYGNSSDFMSAGDFSGIYAAGPNFDDPGVDDINIWPNNLWAQYNLDSVTMATISDLRTAFQIQRLLERDAYGGSRYVELLKAHFGVTSPDARLQRSEYLGGNRIPLNVHQVVNSSSQGEVPLGELGALSHTVDIHEDFVKSFTEHGWIITVCCVRYQNVYAQGLERFWSLSDRYSYYWPVLAHLGNQAVLNKEIYALDDYETGEEVFGYQEAWYDLRTRQNRCSSELRPGVTNSLATWNLADYYTDTPVLSDGWIRSQPDIVDRVLAVSHDVSKQIFADFYFENHATRVIPLYSIPGLIDHF